MAHAGLHAQHFQRTTTDLADIVVARIVDLARQHNSPLNPGRAQYLKWGRIDSGSANARAALPSSEIVSKENSSPVTNSSINIV